MSNINKSLYLELLKKTLTFSLWPEPPIPIDYFKYARPKYQQVIITFIANLLNKKRLVLARMGNITTEQIENGYGTPVYSDTMIGLKRLNNLEMCIESIINDNIEGDLIETGVWKGGACIFMKAVLESSGIKNRKIFVADSFKGLPMPDKVKYPMDANDEHYKNDYLKISKETVENNFKKYNLLDDNVIFLEGWFKDTLPVAPIEKLSILRLDGDMYGSTMDALTNLYPKLSKGGFIIIDDYGAVEGCKKAVTDYRHYNNITTHINNIDWGSVYWRKE